MTLTRNEEFNAGELALQMILEHGTERLTEAFRILPNEAMVARNALRRSGRLPVATRA